MQLLIRSEDSEMAMQFAHETIHGTYDRMRYDTEDPRLFHIYVGKVVEQTTFRYLREELGLDITESPSMTGPDQFDFTIKNGKTITGDVKSVHVYWTWGQSIRQPHEVIQQCWALVPVDQYSGQPKDLYIFPIILADKQDSGYLSADAVICFISWATYTDISTWNRIPSGTKVFPYNATRTDNYGSKISECRIIEDLPDYLFFLMC